MLLINVFSHNFSNKQKHIHHDIYLLNFAYFLNLILKIKISVYICGTKNPSIYFSSLSVKCQFGHMTSIILEKINKNKTNVIQFIHSFYTKAVIMHFWNYCINAESINGTGSFKSNRYRANLELVLAFKIMFFQNLMQCSLESKWVSEKQFYFL